MDRATVTAARGTLPPPPKHRRSIAHECAPTPHGAGRRASGWLAAGLLAMGFLVSPARSGEVEKPGPWTHAIAIAGPAKYRPDFRHYDFVNPNAAKGCTWRQASVGTGFDSLNPFIIAGRMAIPIYRHLFDSLLAGSPDEKLAAYAHVASRLRFGPRDAWVEFDIRPEARWHDGKPMLARDLAYSAKALGKHGRPFYRSLFRRVRVEVRGPRRIRVHLSGVRPRQLALSYATLPILPEHWWRSRDFSRPSLEPPLGSGAYKVARVDPGRRLVLDRVKDYWARNLPTMQGANNFDRLDFLYLRDRSAAFEAFLGGDLDTHIDQDPRRIKTRYDTAQIRDGRIRLHTLRNWYSSGMNGYFFNLRRRMFADPRVRRALVMMYDFEWANRVLFGQGYVRTRSYFENTDMAALDAPTARERAFLARYRDELPAAALNRAFTPPVSDGTGRDRRQLKRALALLAEAGWRMKDGTMRNERTGEPLRFTVLSRSSRPQLFLGHWFKSLARIGIDARLQIVDGSVYYDRLRKRRFDVIQRFTIPGQWPGAAQKSAWHSKGDGNLLGLKSRLVDDLVEKIAASTVYAETRFYARLLDRALQWQHLGVPGQRTENRIMAAWRRMVPPKRQPAYSFGYDYWSCRHARPAQ